MSQRVLKQKKTIWNHLNAFTNQCITLEFFGSVIAPLMPVNFQAHFCGVDSKGKVVQFVDIATSCVCVVNQKGWRSHVYEYWLPDVSTLSCEELYLVLEGEQVEAIVQSSKLGNLVDLSRALPNCKKKDSGKRGHRREWKARDGRGRKRKRNEPAADDTVEAMHPVKLCKHHEKRSKADVWRKADWEMDQKRSRTARFCTKLWKHRHRSSK
uniref:Uncharacterized protein n=1 Tax=Ditylenchus dipsaci TaxID=166011 RepID=A0A915D0S8_9BILA